MVKDDFTLVEKFDDPAFADGYAHALVDAIRVLESFGFRDAAAHVADVLSMHSAVLR